MTGGVDHAGAGSSDVPFNRVLCQAERHLTRRLDAVLSGEHLTVDQWRVLDLLADGEGHPMSEIAGAIVVPGPSLTKIVDRLVDAAAVYRLVDDRDRRRVLVFVSRHGREVHRRLAPLVRAADAEALGDLGEDAAVLLRLLTRLTDSSGSARTRG